MHADRNAARVGAIRAAGDLVAKAAARIAVQMADQIVGRTVARTATWAQLARLQVFKRVRRVGQLCSLDSKVGPMVGRAKLAGVGCVAVGPAVARAKRAWTAHLVFRQPQVPPTAWEHVRAHITVILQTTSLTPTTIPSSRPTKTRIWAPKVVVQVEVVGQGRVSAATTGNRFGKMATATARVVRATTAARGPSGPKMRAPAHPAIQEASKAVLTATISPVGRFPIRCALQSVTSVLIATNASDKKQVKDAVALVVVAAKAVVEARAVAISRVGVAGVGARQPQRKPLRSCVFDFRGATRRKLHGGNAGVMQRFPRQVKLVGFAQKQF